MGQVLHGSATLIADKAYDARRLRRGLARKGCRAVIPFRANAFRRKLVLEIAGRAAEFVPASQLNNAPKADRLIGEKMRGTRFLAP